MPRMISVQTMLAQLEGLLGTNDLSEWEQEFVGNIIARTTCRRFAQALSDKQIDKIESIYRQHFA